MLAKGNNDSGDFHPPGLSSIYQLIVMAVIACFVHPPFVLRDISLARLGRVGKLRYGLYLYPYLPISFYRSLVLGGVLNATGNLSVAIELVTAASASRKLLQCAPRAVNEIHVQSFPILQCVSAPVAQTVFGVKKCGGHTWPYTTVMPPNRAPSEQGFNTNLLEPESLVAPGGVQAVLRSVERVCYHGDSSIAEMVVGLSSRPHILEYILSSTLCIPMVPMGLIKQARTCSLERPGPRKIIQVGDCPVPYAWHTRCDGNSRHQTPSTAILIFNVRRRGVNNGTPQGAQGISEESRLIFGCFEGARRMRRSGLSRCKYVPNQSQKAKGVNETHPTRPTSFRLYGNYGTSDRR